MRAGDLRHVVTIKAPTRTRTASGSFADSWADVVTNCRAAIEPISGREVIAGAAEVAQQTIRIWIRYAPSITPQCQVYWTDETGANRVFAINHIRNVDMKSRAIELLCTEAVQ